MYIKYVYMRNRHNLSRNIPNEVKYAIRRNSYFGCVNCGLAIGQYEHIDPEWKDATEHNPANMTFLCGSCHDRVTRGVVSKKTVKRWSASPWGKENGSCHDSLDIDPENFALWFGGCKFVNVNKIISIDDEPLFEIRPSGSRGEPIQIDAIFHDENDNEVMSIVENEWMAKSDMMDIVCVGSRILVRNNGKTILKIVSYPPSVLVIEYLEMMYKGLRVVANRSGLFVDNNRGNKVRSGVGALYTSGNGDSYVFNFDSSNPRISMGGDLIISTTDEVMPMVPIRRNKIGVNKLCPCGSGKKYKKCCYPRYDYSI